MCVTYRHCVIECARIPLHRREGSRVAAKAESTGPTPEQTPHALSARDSRILDFERQWWRHAGAKEEAIRSEFGLSVARYYQVLNAVLDSPAAVVSDPMLVKRLRRLRDTRTLARSARVIGDAASDNTRNI